MKWKNGRPDGWKNPHLKHHYSSISPTECKCWYCTEWRAYEAGADAYEEALKKEGIYGKPTGDLECFCMVKPDECADPYNREHFPKQPMYPDDITVGHKKGWLVFIPDEEVE